MTPLFRDHASTPAGVSLAVFASSLSVYVATAARSVYWGDSTELVAACHALGIAHPPGYPLYTLLGALAVRLSPANPFFTMSLVSALFASAAAAVVSMTVWVATGFVVPSELGHGPRAIARAAGSLLGGLALAFTPIFWAQSTVPEVYTLAAFLVFAVVLLLCLWLREADGDGAPEREAVRRSEPLYRNRSILLVGLFLGLAFAHHLTAVFVVPSVIIALFWRGQRRPGWRPLAAALGLLLLAMSLYLYLPIRAAHNPPVLWAPIDSCGALAGHLAGTQYASRLFAAPLVEVRHNLSGFALGLPGEVTWPFMLLAAVGLVALWMSRRVLFLVLTVEAALVLAHAVVYKIPDIEPYYIPIYGVLAVAAGVGLGAAVRAAGRLSRRWRLAVSCLAIVVAVGLTARRVPARWEERNLSYRTDGAAYVDRLLRSVEPGGMVAAMTDRVIFPLTYARFVEGRREDVAILNVRERAPHLQRWFSGIRFPTEEELLQNFRRTQGDAVHEPGVVPSAREQMSVGNYLSLLVSLNQETRPIYADAELGRTLFLERCLPRGLLVEISPSPLDSIPPSVLAEHREVWDNFLGELESDFRLDRRTAEIYSKTLAEHGSLFIARGMIDDAIEILERARALAPSVAMARSNLGVAYDRADRFEESVAEFEAALELNPGLAAAHYNIYNASARRGQHDRARRELESAVKLAPREARYRVELGALYEKAGEVEKAELMFGAAPQIAPDDWAATLAWGDFLSRQKRYSEAVGAYRRAEELNPDSAGALRGLGRCYWALNDSDRAIETTRRLVELQPHNPTLKYDLATMLWRAERPHEALRLLDDVARILPGMWQSLARKGQILGELGRYWEARAEFEDALELGASGEAFWKAWAEMEEAAGDTARARRLRADSVERGPSESDG